MVMTLVAITLPELREHPSYHCGLKTTALQDHHTAASGSSVYCGAWAKFASCSLRALSRSAAHSAELAGAVKRKNMLNGGTSCRNR